jgi:hypothetical protein
MEMLPAGRYSGEPGAVLGDFNRRSLGQKLPIAGMYSFHAPVIAAPASLARTGRGMREVAGGEKWNSTRSDIS